MAGKIPPPVMPSFGIEVKNSQLITDIPLIIINPRIRNNIATTRKLISVNAEKAINWDIRFFVVIVIYTFLDFALSNSTVILIPKVIINRTIPRAKSAL